MFSWKDDLRLEWSSVEWMGHLLRTFGIGFCCPPLTDQDPETWKKWSFQSESVSRSVVFDSATPWTVAHQAPLSMGFFRQEHWSGVPFPSPGDLPNLGLEPRSPAGQALYQSESPGAFQDHPKYFHRPFWRSALYPALNWVLRTQRSFRYLCTQSIWQLLSGTVGTQKLELKSQCIFQNNYPSSIS